MFSEIIDQAEQAVAQWQNNLPLDDPSKLDSKASNYTPLMAALVSRYLLRVERMTGNARLAQAWLVAKERRWESRDGTFDSFESYWEYVCQDPSLGIKRHSTIWSLTLSFATGLAPWLNQGNCQGITPERFLTEGGYGKTSDINTAWWGRWKEVESKRVAMEIAYPTGVPSQDEQEDLHQAINDRDEVMGYCVGLVMDPKVTRDDLDGILKEKGWRKPRSPPPASWRWTVAPSPEGQENVIVAVRLPRKMLSFFQRVFGHWLSVDMDRPEAIFPT